MAKRGDLSRGYTCRYATAPQRGNASIGHTACHANAPAEATTVPYPRRYATPVPCQDPSIPCGGISAAHIAYPLNEAPRLLPHQRDDSPEGYAIHHATTPQRGNTFIDCTPWPTCVPEKEAITPYPRRHAPPVDASRQSTHPASELGNRPGSIGDALLPPADTTADGPGRFQAHTAACGKYDGHHAFAMVLAASVRPNMAGTYRRAHRRADTRSDHG